METKQERTEALQTAIDECILCWLATVDKNGHPNVSPKEMFVADGPEKILIANIASPNSVRNIQDSPNVCVSFVHVFKQKGFKVKGVASLLQPDDELFEMQLAKLRVLGGEQFSILSIIEIDVVSVVPIIAPSYRVIPGTTEHSQVQSAMQAYGVQPKEA